MINLVVHKGKLEMKAKLTQLKLVAKVDFYELDLTFHK